LSGRGAGEGDQQPRQPPEVLDPRALFKALAEAEVAYILVGGFAVAAHGHIRASEDLDICPSPDPENLTRLADFLEEVDARNLDADEFNADELVPRDFDGLSQGGNFRLRTGLGKFDVLQYLEPFGEKTWESLDKNAEPREVFGHRIRVCGYEDLIKMKTAAGRPKDLSDIADIKAARREL